MWAKVADAEREAFLQFLWNHIYSRRSTPKLQPMTQNAQAKIKIFWKYWAYNMIKMVLSRMYLIWLPAKGSTDFLNHPFTVKKRWKQKKKFSNSRHLMVSNWYTKQNFAMKCHLKILQLIIKIVAN